MTNNAEIARWDERYAGGGYFFGTEPNAFLASQRHRPKAGQKALSIADGEGRNGVWLARQGLEVLAVDFSSNAIQKARRLAALYEVPITVECVDLVTWDRGEPCFDVVVAIFIQFSAPSFRDTIFQLMEHVLNPHGLMLILLEGYRPKQLKYGTGGPPRVENLYTEPLLRAAFGDMEILHLKEYDAALAEGSRHRGMSALIDLVASEK